MPQGTVEISPGTITNAHVAAGAALAADKLQHQYECPYAQPNAAATSETRVVHLVKGAVGEVLYFRAGSIAKAVGNATVTLDLLKNGVSILSAVITLNSSNTAYIAVDAALASAALAAGDVLTVTTVATVGTGTLPTGVFAEVVLRENA